MNSLLSADPRHVSAPSITVVLIAAIALFGCADQGEERDMETDVTDDVQTRVDAGPTEITATLTEWSVELSESEVPAGPVVFRVRNDGSEEHALEVEGEGIEEETETLEAGETANLELDLRPGTYKVYCPVVGDVDHEAEGMVTQLTVREPNTE